MRPTSTRTILPAAAAALLLLTAGAPALAQPIEFDDACIFFELNDTDGDLGIHALIDGEPWRWMQISSPDGKRKMKVINNGTLRQQGLTELFFESAEPPFDELDPADFFARFPEGEWKVYGRTTDGVAMEGESTISHVIPEAPDNVSVNGTALPDGCDGAIPSFSAPFTISWDEVDENHATLGIAGDVEVDSYELVIEVLDEDGQVTVNLPGDVTEFTLSDDAAALGSEFKVEVLVTADGSGNRSAFESCFNKN